MPVLTGRIVDSAESGDRFLWDFRKTIADLLAENHCGQIAESLHARGMGVYGESHESGRATVGDGMEMKRYTDVPMAAMWTQRPGVNAELYHYNADICESASVAHIYEGNYVGALAEYRAVVAQDPGRPGIHYVWAERFWVAGVRRNRPQTLRKQRKNLLSNWTQIRIFPMQLMRLARYIVSPEI